MGVAGLQVADWDAMEEIWAYTIKDQLLCDAQEHPILLAEPNCGSSKDREKTCEMMFESLQVPALFLAKNAALSSFSTGKNMTGRRIVIGQEGGGGGGGGEK